MLMQIKSHISLGLVSGTPSDSEVLSFQHSVDGCHRCKIYSLIEYNSMNYSATLVCGGGGLGVC